MNAKRLRPKQMSLRKKLASAQLVVLAMLPVLALGAPAHAAGGASLQIVRLSGDIDGGRYNKRYEDRQFSLDALDRLQDRIDWAESRGALRAREADSLQERADRLRNRARAYGRSGGLDWQERRDLDERFQDLREEVRHLVWDREYRGQYRQEWRERSLWGENGWRGDGDRDDSELKGPQFDRNDDAADFDGPESRANPQKAAPKQYDAPKNDTPNARASGDGKTQAPSSRDDQPFKDGRDFH